MSCVWSKLWGHGLYTKNQNARSLKGCMYLKKNDNIQKKNELGIVAVLSKSV